MSNANNNANTTNNNAIVNNTEFAKRVREVIQTAESTNFADVRRALQAAGIVPASCREVGWYKYWRNGGVVRMRAAGEIASVVRTAAVALGGCWKEYPSISWCGRWTRTKQSIDAEDAGTELARQYLAYLLNN